ncbi:ABC transporter ATP-binding protein [Sedimentibacter hydroxybenzoicus DSM 7310]|uniref:ABC transporter ATP-binding protein n=1 Tax=Sedimentibacter hydroxybenzoicus DSM 7310 TaxID=1123245 RepID=A0A974BMS8_SEDHY|nr:ABC transporter ATP-binding protein [Sedimentibacter hydroxybenzoicus]NYB75957.1 ABC transporter ATP-binding protein [Sedimentibacter hydroxybenzoicus DSM 7310]
MIIAEHLKKTYIVKQGKGLFREKQEIQAVRDISLQIEKGKIVGLLGINGAGKTTTIKMLTTLLSPTEGSYFLDDIDGVKYPVEIKKRINMIAGGERMIYWRLTAYENLWYYGQIYNVSNNVLKERIDTLLKLVGLENKKDVPVETFSKGMKQRLQIARGLINDPQYLFLDEPTIGLDAVVSKELRSHIKHLAKEQNKGILITSHYMGEIEELCDYIYIMNDGVLIKKGTVKELTTETFNRKNYVLRLDKHSKEITECICDKLKVVDATVEVKDENDAIYINSRENISMELSRACMEAGLYIREMYEKEPHLEDAIIRLSREVHHEAVY